jgi:hypothetical protein
MIGDAKGGDESALAQALEAFDILSNTTDEYLAAVKNQPRVAVEPATEAARIQPQVSSNPFQVRRSMPVDS